MMSPDQDVPFVSPSPFERVESGLESVGGQAALPPAEKPSDSAPPSESQKARANDLFLRGALTPEELEKAKANRGGFEAVVGKSNFLPAVFLEIGASTSRSTCHIRTSGVDFLGRSGSWSGTGFLIAPNVLVTNNHVLNSPEVAAAGTCVFDFQVGVDGRPRHRGASGSAPICSSSPARPSAGSTTRSPGSMATPRPNSAWSGSIARRSQSPRMSSPTWSATRPGG